MVYYRTYRPKRIQEIDKESIREKIYGLFSKGKSIPHALLFSGPKGTGKTSTARIIAKLVNCTNLQKNSEPCTSCLNCKAIQEGTHLDIVEIDAASNRGIDEIRELREHIALTPSMGSHKVYIIDEAHMLTRDAFNALLKTLEEPPKHVVFILATTEEYKLPDTIISRCVVFSFTKATKKELLRSLYRVVKGEKLNVPENVLSTIATYADGSFRDASKLLEQAVIEKKLTYEGILSLLNITQSDRLITALLDKDVKKALSILEEQGKSGADFILYIKFLLDTLHQKLLKNPHDKKWHNLIKLLMRAYQDTRTASIPQLPLELAVIEYCYN